MALLFTRRYPSGSLSLPRSPLSPLFPPCFTQKSHSSRAVFSSPVLSFPLFRSQREQDYDRYLITSPSSSFIRFLVAPRAILFLSFPLGLSLFTSPRSCISRKSIVLSVRVPPPSYFSRPRRSLLPFYGPLAFIRFSFCSLHTLRPSLPASIHLIPSRRLAFFPPHSSSFFPFLLIAERTYSTFLHSPVISIECTGVGACSGSILLAIQSFSLVKFLIPIVRR